MLKRLNANAKNALYIGVLCSVSYLAVYFARNILSAVTPQMLEDGFSEAYIGEVSSLFLILYAVGQLINGVIGDRIKAKYMISFGLLFAAVGNLLFCYLPRFSVPAAVGYGLSGFALSMIYGPMTKVVAENTEWKYTARCSLGYTFSSFFGSPLAGVCATFLTWQSVFSVGTVTLVTMAVLCFGCFGILEKKGIVRYGQYDAPQNRRVGMAGIRILLRRQIVGYTLISMLTGIVRTSVVFWLPTYILQHLGFSGTESASIFSVVTLLISLSAFAAIFLYERIGRNMERATLLLFSASAVFFLLTSITAHSYSNLICLVLAIFCSNGAASVLWSIYSPSLRDTGLVSGATGFLDFASYAAAAAFNLLFADAVSAIGWGGMILVWCGLMLVGIAVSVWNLCAVKRNTV